MKTFKNFFPLVLGMLVLFGGCKDDDKMNYQTYENHEIEVCGVKDPLNNLPWLREKISRLQWAENTILLYEDITTREHYVRTSMCTGFVPDRSPSQMCIDVMYNCKGEQLFEERTEGPPPQGEWKNWKTKLQFVAVIWQRNVSN